MGQRGHSPHGGIRRGAPRRTASPASGRQGPELPASARHAGARSHQFHPGLGRALPVERARAAARQGSSPAAPSSAASKMAARRRGGPPPAPPAAATASARPAPGRGAIGAVAQRVAQPGVKDLVGGVLASYAGSGSAARRQIGLIAGGFLAQPRMPGRGHQVSNSSSGRCRPLPARLVGEIAQGGQVERGQFGRGWLRWGASTSVGSGSPAAVRAGRASASWARPGAGGAKAVDDMQDDIVIGRVGLVAVREPVGGPADATLCRPGAARCRRLQRSRRENQGRAYPSSARDDDATGSPVVVQNGPRSSRWSFQTAASIRSLNGIGSASAASGKRWKG